MRCPRGACRGLSDRTKPSLHLLLLHSYLRLLTGPCTCKFTCPSTLPDSCTFRATTGNHTASSPVNVINSSPMTRERRQSEVELLTEQPVLPGGSHPYKLTSDPRRSIDGGRPPPGVCALANPPTFAKLLQLPSEVRTSTYRVDFHDVGIRFERKVADPQCGLAPPRVQVVSACLAARQTGCGR